MTLWDVEIAPLETAFTECPSSELRTLGLAVIDETLALYGQPLEELFDAATVSLVAVACEEFRTFPIPTEEVSARWDLLFEQACSWQDDIRPLTKASLMQAVAEYSVFLIHQDVQQLLETLSCCYESVLSFASIARLITVDMERNNTFCHNAIALQKRLIEELCGVS
ncbi:hypothetical protein [Nocardia sp. NPDC056100]|uniref:hypothetical protein n=1 Tax=Nocardia sp. NPDC056100 TaxID=3345712 RepID=UPI0035DD09D2